jgi:hypothetical protein
MIYQTSRYYTQVIDFISFSEEGDNYPIVFYEFDVLGTTTWSEHIYSEGERLEQLSQKYYFRPDLWWIIPEYNPSISDFTNIKPGTVLKIPNV